MVALLKPFQNLLSPGRIVPMGKLVIDWAHPLTNGLLACYVPGVMGGINVTGRGGDLAGLSSAPISILSLEGPCLKADVDNTGMWANCPPDMLNLSEYSVYWRAMGTGTPFNDPDLFGISYTNSNSNPYISFSISHGPGQPSVFWATGGSYHTYSPGYPAISAGTLLSFGATIKAPSDFVNAYSNGVNIGSTATDSGTISFGNSLIELCVYQNSTNLQHSNAATFIACIWGRKLSDADMALIDANPYAFLLPAESELPALYVAAGGGGGTKFSRVYVMG